LRRKERGSSEGTLVICPRPSLLRAEYQPLATCLSTSCTGAPHNPGTAKIIVPQQNCGCQINFHIF